MTAPGMSPLDGSVDALSDLLDLIRLHGDDLALQRSTDGRELRRHGDRMLYLVQEGTVRLTVDDGDRIELVPGDLALLATGAAHGLRAPDGGTWMSGRIVIEERSAATLFEVLPATIVLHGTEPGYEWLPIAAGLLAVELDDPSAGSRAMVSRLLDLLFIRALRAWSARDDAPRIAGWLTAALDRPLGPALTAMHRNPERPWTVDDLAATACMSRAAFAARFGRLMGESPGRYLAQLRLRLAAEHLASTAAPVGEIGHAVGYASEPAFSRAFAREYGASPRDWRDASRRPQP